MTKIKSIFERLSRGFKSLKPQQDQIKDGNRTYFLITAYTAGALEEEKKNHLIAYIGNIRRYYPNSFIILVDSFIIKEIGNLCDIYVHESKNNNVPHGQGDLDKIKIGLSILDGLGAQWFIRSSYDYWLNDTIFLQSQEWISMIKNGKKVVSSKWKWEKDQKLPKSIATRTISTGYGCYTVNAAKILFGFNKVSAMRMMEKQVYSILIKNFSPDEYFLYDCCEDMFNDVCFDVFNNSGLTLNKKRMSATL